MDSQTRLNIANQLTREVLSEPNPAVSLLREQGKVNTAFTIGTPSCDYILRIRFSPNEMRQFEAEKRCAELIRDDLGEDWTPRVLQIGQFEDVCYSFQEKVEGAVASKYQGDLGDVWEQVGGYAAKFHQIGVPGYGFQIFSEMTDKSDR